MHYVLDSESNRIYKGDTVRYTAMISASGEFSSNELYTVIYVDYKNNMIETINKNGRVIRWRSKYLSKVFVSKKQKDHFPDWF